MADRDDEFDEIVRRLDLDLSDLEDLAPWTEDDDQSFEDWVRQEDANQARDAGEPETEPEATSRGDDESGADGGEGDPGEGDPGEGETPSDGSEPDQTHDRPSPRQHSRDPGRPGPGQRPRFSPFGRRRGRGRGRGLDHRRRPERGSDAGQAQEPTDFDDMPDDRSEQFYRDVPIPPRRTPSRTRIAAWVAVLGGPSLLVLSTLVGFWLPRPVVLAAALTFVAGAIYLISQLPEDGPGRRDWPDDGAEL